MLIVIRFYTAAILMFVVSFSVQAGEVSPQDAIRHVGEQATVVGVVSQVSNSGKGTTFINFGGRYPNHAFYAVIFRDQGDKFPSVYTYEGRTLAVKGTIKLYRGKPQIILSSPDQIEVR